MRVVVITGDFWEGNPEVIVRPERKEILETLDYLLELADFQDYPQHSIGLLNEVTFHLSFEEIPLEEFEALEFWEP